MTDEPALTIEGREVAGFLRADGQRLVNGEGREVVLRGVGLGSWLLPEGYMWLLPDAGDRPRKIERMIADLIGAEKAERFWRAYYDRYIGEADIRQIAREGYNSVRVPILARFLRDEERFRLLDRLIGWCRTHRLYVVLDLHGAAGGQTGTNIDDSAADHPDLFTDKRNLEQTVALWRALAERYRDEWIVAGYDLLNEPLPEWFSAYNDRVMPLYKQITQAIREVDGRHLIIVEGVHWATDWSIFDEDEGPFDDNLMLQFHKYWNSPDTASIRPYLDKREAWNVPIYMGEGGENNKDWYAGAFRLFEDHGISWNFWTWKKMGRDNSPCSVIEPAGWQQLIDFIEGGAKPDERTAERILWAYLDNIAFERCVYHRDVTDALLRRPPARLPAVFYSFRGEGVGYRVGRKSEGRTAFRVDDGTDIRFVDSARAQLNFQHTRGESWRDDEWLWLQMADGDWFAYDFCITGTGDAREASTFALELCLCAPGGAAAVEAAVNGVSLGAAAAAAAERSCRTVRLPGSARLAPGEHRIVLTAGEGGAGLLWLRAVPLHPPA